MSFKKPLGTVDFYPEQKAEQKAVFNLLRASALKFGFREIETPAFETIELLTKKSGEEVSNQIFTLEQKGKEKFALRFDLTVPITRLFMEKQKELPRPIKWFAIDKMWRYERPQAGRRREFYQLSVEMFGSAEPEADAEIINLATQCLKSLGLTNKDFYIRLNNRKLLEGLLQEFTVKNITQLISLGDKKEKLSEKDFEASAKDLGVKDTKKLKNTIEIKDLKELEKLEMNPLAREGFEELKAILPILDKKYVQLDLSTARGLAYYTGTVFELFDKSGKYRALAGGGRYDNMVELFGGESCPATGFAIGYATLSLLLKDNGLMPKSEEGPDYYVAILGDVKKQALKIIAKLRETSSVDYDLVGKSFKKQLNYADKIKAKNLIVIGEDEIKSKKFKVKDMKTGIEKPISL